MRPLYYILRGHKAVPVHHVVFSRWYSQHDDRHVGEDFVGDPRQPKTMVRISTVFLGLDHQFNEKGPPILFETMVFGGKLDTAQWRYATWDEAEKGHRGIDRVRTQRRGSEGMTEQAEQQSTGDLLDLLRLRRLDRRNCDEEAKERLMAAAADEIEILIAELMKLRKVSEVAGQLQQERIETEQLVARLREAIGDVRGQRDRARLRAQRAERRVKVLRDQIDELLRAKKRVRKPKVKA